MSGPSVAASHAPNGAATIVPISALDRPITSPSTSTTRRTTGVCAPSARSTPISRVRSSTLMLMVLASPNPPTSATSATIDSSRIAMMSRLAATDWRLSAVTLLRLTSSPN